MKTNSVIHSLSLETNVPRFIAIGLLGSLLLCALARGQATNPPTVNPAGVYALTGVDGKTVPCTINHEGTAMDVQSGTFTITTNGECTSVMVVSVGERKNIRCETHATYSLVGAELTMKWQGAGMTKGRVTGQTFSMTNEGMVYTYRK